MFRSRLPRRSAKRSLAPLALLAATLIALLASAPATSAQDSETPAGAATVVEVPWTWPLLPDGVGPGETFRLLFVTSRVRDATARYNGTYNTFVQEEAAGGYEAIRQYEAHFRVLGATSDVGARSNTGAHLGVNGVDVPIYWLNGPRVAEANADLFAGTWEHANPGRLPDGEALTFEDDTLVFTGIRLDGEAPPRPLGGGGRCGLPETRAGRPEGGNPLSDTVVASTESHRFYALSGLFRVTPPPAVLVGLEHILTAELTADDGGEDFYSLAATAGEQYIIEVKAPMVPDGGGDLDLVPGYLIDPSILRIVDGDGVELLGEHDQGGFTLNWARAFFTAPATDTYYVAVGAGAQHRHGLGSYTISVRADDHADDYATHPAIVLRPGESIGGRIDSDVAPTDPRLHSWAWKPAYLSGPEPWPRLGIESLDDRDLFRFEIAEGGLYRLLVLASSDQVGAWVVWDHMGNLWSYPQVSPARSFIADYEPGTYYVEIGTAYESSGATGSYSLSLDEYPLVNELRDCLDGPTTHCRLPVGSPRTGVVDRHIEVDYWGLTLVGGGTYIAEVRGDGDRSGDDENGGTLGDPFIRLRNDTGDLLAENDNIAPDNRNARITFTVPTHGGGTYYLVVSEASGVTAMPSTYTISIVEGEEAPLDEVGDCSASSPATCHLPVGEPRRGQIHAPSDGGLPDADVWAMELAGDSEYVIEVKGAGDVSGRNDNGGSLPDPFAGVFQVEGIVLVADADVSPANRNARLVISVPADLGGTYFLHVFGYGGVFANTGTYTVSLVEVEQ
jgi:hypothetical protein